MINIFINTYRGKLLPNDCIENIKNIYKKLEHKNVCSFCKSFNVTWGDYIDGVGYICPICYVF